MCGRQRCCSVLLTAAFKRQEKGQQLIEKWMTWISNFQGNNNSYCWRAYYVPHTLLSLSLEFHLLLFSSFYRWGIWVFKRWDNLSKFRIVYAFICPVTQESRKKTFFPWIHNWDNLLLHYPFLYISRPASVCITFIIRKCYRLLFLFF